MLQFLIAAAFANPDCEELTSHKEIVKYTGDAAATAFIGLSECTPDVAKKYISTTVPTFFGTEVGTQAAVTAVKLGGAKTVLDWMTTLEPSEQKVLLRSLGNDCQQDEVVRQMFLDVAANDPERFWGNRFYQYLSECRVDSIQTLLQDKFHEGTDQGYAQYFSVASVYARNLESISIPILSEALAKATDGNVQSNLISSISEAVTTTLENHADDKKLVRDVGIAGIDAIFGKASMLTPEALTQARISLTALNAEAEVDELAGYYYQSYKQPDGNLLWGLVIVEDAVCKKGKPKQRIHVTSIVEPGTNWADTLTQRVQEPAEYQWGLKLGEECKGTSETRYFVTEKPVHNQEELLVWQQEQLKAYRNTELSKIILLEVDPLSL